MVQLFCPKCEEVLEIRYQNQDFNGTYGLLECACSVHPVIADIPIIYWEKSNEGEKLLEKTKRLIRQGENKQAFLELCRHKMRKRSKPEKKIFAGLAGRTAAKLFKTKNRDLPANDNELATKFLLEDPSRYTAEELIDFYFKYFGYNNKNARDYFYYRFTQPRHLISLSLATALFNDTDVIVDLACGMGHITRGIKHAHNSCEVIGVDNDFFLLYIARHSIARQAEFICADAGSDLPFKTDSVDGVLCVNAFHFFSNKEHCAQELNRIANEDGVIILAALRHADYSAVTPNQAISIQGYIDLFDFASVGVYSDNDILQRYLKKEGPDLENNLSVLEAREQALVSLVAARRGRLLRSYGRFDEYPHALGTLQLNPLYKQEDADSGAEIIRLELSCPSQFYKDEHPEMTKYLPHEVSIPKDVLTDHDKKAQLVEKLASKHVLIDMPSNYTRQPPIIDC